MKNSKIEINAWILFCSFFTNLSCIRSLYGHFCYLALLSWMLNSFSILRRFNFEGALYFNYLIFESEGLNDVQM